MQASSELQRRSLGCGYLPPTDGRTHLSVWQPPLGNDRVGYRGPALTVCAGFTANLPEVTEAAIARAHWKHGALGLWCEGEQVSEVLLNEILILDSEFSALEAWLMAPVEDGGGRY